MDGFIKNLPLANEQKNIINSKQCDIISKSLSNYRVGITDHLNTDSFRNVNFFDFDFKDCDDIEYLYKEKKLDLLYDVFKKYIKNDTAYQYYSNILWLYNTSDNLYKDTGYKNHEECSIMPHTDRSLGYTPLKIFVLYIRLPNNFEGGDLKLYSDYDNNDYVTVKPEIGKLISFNGSLCHSITKFKCNEDEYRLSVVWEVYGKESN